MKKFGARENNMGQVRAPRSLRAGAALKFIDGRGEGPFVTKVSAVAGLMAVASVSSAEAQPASDLPPVNVDAPIARELRDPFQQVATERATHAAVGQLHETLGAMRRMRN